MSTTDSQRHFYIQRNDALNSVAGDARGKLGIRHTKVQILTLSLLVWIWIIILTLGLNKLILKIIKLALNFFFNSLWKTARKIYFNILWSTSISNYYSFARVAVVLAVDN